MKNRTPRVQVSLTQANLRTINFALDIVGSHVTETMDDNYDDAMEYFKDKNTTKVCRNIDSAQKAIFKAINKVKVK